MENIPTCLIEVYKKIPLVIGITILFLGVGIQPAIADVVKEPYKPLSKGNTLYVGGTGPGNYTKIQDAIDDSVDGNTVFVYAYSSPYYERLKVNKSINLIGEDKNLTFIDGNRTNGDTINVIADNVTITGFTIQHSGKQKGDSGIKLNSNNNNVEDNIIRENGWIMYYYKQGGLYINEGSHNTIINNTIINNREAGIYLHYSDNNIIKDNAIYENTALGIISNASSYNIITHNDVYENFCGMTFWPYSTYNIIEENNVNDHLGCGIAFKMYSDHNIIRYNRFINNLEWSIMLGFGPTKHNIVEYNLISGTTGGQQNWFEGSGLVLSIAFKNKIRYNNFIGNKHDVYLENSVLNLWNKNYWDIYKGFGIKIIRGHFAKLYTYHPEKKISWINIDWLPAKEPYDI
jgi:parallel beta-helix repeat protein